MQGVKFIPDDGKLIELMLYVAERSQSDPYFGAVKLNKVLFHADFRAYRYWGRPITGQAYFRLAEGPAPQMLRKIRDEMVNDKIAAVETVHVFGLEQYRLVPKRSADSGRFSEEELALVDDVLNEMAGLTAAQVTAASHRLPGWRAANDREVIPYETAFLSSDMTDADRVWAVGIAVENAWI